MLQTLAGAERRVPDMSALAPFSAELTRAQLCNLALELELTACARERDALAAQVATLTHDLQESQQALIALAFVDNRTRREVARSVQHKAQKHRKRQR